VFGSPLFPHCTKSCSVSSATRNKGILSFYDFRASSPEDLNKHTKILIDEVKAVYDAVGSVDKEKVTFDNVIKPLVDIDREAYTRTCAITFPSMVALDKDLREASREAAKRLSDFSVEMGMRKDIFDNIVAFSLTDEAKSLDPEFARLVEKVAIEGRRSGLHLAEDKRLVIENLMKNISDLGLNYNKNLNEDTSFILFDESELSGVPEDIVKSLEKNEFGKLKVTMKYPHHYPVTRKCNNPKTRFKVEKTFNSPPHMAENTAILEKIVELRRTLAELLGYNDHASYVQEVMMAKNPDNVEDFLNELGVKLSPLWKQEQNVMLEMKEAEADQLGFKFSGKLDYWDLKYYQAMVEEKLYAVDQSKLREYFPIEVVTSGIMDIYQEILGLKFTKIKEGEVWHDDVEMWKVNDKISGENLGFFYLDLYPRDGKFGHACAIQLQPGCLDGQGRRQKSVVAMLTNFRKPTKEKPSLLDHKEVHTFFHEFGHVMHGICSQANTSRYFGTNVEKDFVEAPSQMLENWVWEKESLKLISRHYENGSNIPEDMLDKLVASKKANAGGSNLAQVLLATFDQRLHRSKTREDTAKLIKDLSKEILGIETIPGTNFAAIFSHLIGYDAQYYGYLWSQVYCQDMFDTRFAREGIMNQTTGLDYRNVILKPGGSIDASDLLLSFLGRKPTQDAFLRSKGLVG